MTPPGQATPARRKARRELAYAVLACLAGAGLALFAASRTWAVEVTARPAPLPDVRDSRSGGELVPWLPALAVVGLAGAGALLAARGAVRAAVGGLLTLCGAGLVVGAVIGGMTGATWPVLCAIGGAGLAAGGLLTIGRGRGWPAMGARYERRAAPAPTGTADASRDGMATWDAIDRGEDPTDR